MTVPPSLSPSPQDTEEPLSHIHFTAEGEVTFKSILFVPASAPRGMFDEYGSKKNDFIKVRSQPHANDGSQVFNAFKMEGF